jgi:hypothetical protein
MKAAALVFAAVALAGTTIAHAASSPVPPSTGTEVQPFQWMESAPGLEGLTEYQASLVLNTQPSLPVVLDEITTLVAVSFDGLTFVYDYTLAIPSNPQMDIEQFKAAQLSLFCDALKQMIRPGELESLRYRYVTTDGKTLSLDVTGSDCGIA